MLLLLVHLCRELICDMLQDLLQVACDRTIFFMLRHALLKEADTL